MTTINLTGVSYQEDFNTLGDGLPSGWAIYTDATSSSLGTLIDFNSAPKSWDNTAGGFRNVASANSELEEGDAASEQKDVSDRALGIRQTGSFGDPGAAFVLSLTDTEGFQDFQLSLEAQMLSVKNRSTSWIIDYRIGTEGDFLPLGTYDDPGKWGVTQLTTGSELLDFGDAIDNQSELVQIRVVALSDSTNSNYRDTVAIDNFSLNYSPVEDTSDPDELAPRVLAIQRPDTIDESTTEETIIYEVSFSEAVNEVDVADFSLTTTGTATANIASVSAESGTMIEVILEGVDGDGTLRLDVLPDTAMIVNDAGVALTEAFEAGDRYRIEDPTQDNETGDSNSDSDDSDVEPQPDPEADSNSDSDDSDVEPQPEPTANRSSRRVINQLILGSGTEPETLIGGDGNDTIAAFDYDDVIFAQGGDNLLFGNKGNDRIYSRDGDDTLFGGQDDDLLIGGPGDTVLSGDFGNDTLSGGGGDNLFILRPESSHDVITDFNPDRDRLGLSHGLTSEDLTWTQQGNHTLIQIDRSGRAIATLQNTAANLLNPSQMLPIRYPGLE